MLENANRDTRLIPGHGPLSTMEDLLAYRNMLVDAKEKVQQAIMRGSDVEKLKGDKVLKHLAVKWGNGFIKQDAFVEIIVESLNE